MVPGEGNPAADVWLIGRDPGFEEELAGRPFVGASGHLLNTVLQRAGITRSECYVDNVVQTKPPGNQWDAHPKGAVQAGQERLWRLYDKHKPKLVVAFGGNAFATFAARLTDTTYELPTITEARGYLFPLDHGLLLPTLHPAAILREWVPWRVLFEWDMKKVSREVREGFPPLPRREVRIVGPNDMLGVSVIESTHSAWHAVDIENRGDLAVSCVGIATSTSDAYVFAGEPTKALTRWLEGGVPKVLQNGMYDRFLLSWKYGITVANVVHDTMLAWHALMPELAGMRDDGNVAKKMRRKTQKGLRFLASIYTRDTWWKDYGFDNERQQFLLCGLDCCITLDIAEQQKRQLEHATAPTGAGKAVGMP